eukprot:COSAG01_NODE_26809_length_702_cov_2.978441_2_plen_60_part_01
MGGMRGGGGAVPTVFLALGGGEGAAELTLRYGRYRDKLKDADFYQFAPLHPKLISAMDQV